MPYIKEPYRVILDPLINDLSEKIKSLYKEDLLLFPGLLNYCITKLSLTTSPGIRYSTIATITGVLKNVSDEFYRRIGITYENKQCEDNGDVY